MVASGASLNFRRRTAEKMVTSSVYETLPSARADHCDMTLRGKRTSAKRPGKNKRLVKQEHRAMKARLLLTE